MATQETIEKAKSWVEKEYDDLRYSKCQCKDFVFTKPPETVVLFFNNSLDYTTIHLYSGTQKRRAEPAKERKNGKDKLDNYSLEHARQTHGPHRY